jgi:endo-1,4-beta-mannosidase
MTTAFVKIHSFINSLNDDEIIRATDQQLSDIELKKDKNIDFDNDKGATHLYFRT